MSIEPLKITEENEFDFPVQVGELTYKIQEVIDYCNHEDRYWSGMSVEAQMEAREIGELLTTIFEDHLCDQ